MALGFYLLLAAFALSAYSTWAGASGIKLNKNSLVKNAQKAIYGQFFLVTISVVFLAYSLITRDFSLKYVAEYSDRQLPMIYTISALWAGQAGSLLFWAWLLTIFNALYVFINRNRQSKLYPYVFTIHSVVTLFFLMLVVYTSNPFEKLPHLLPDGYGLNPLLQNPEMIFHPPTLFLGFAGFTLPFAFALAALIKGNLSSEWLDQSRNWTLFAWISLTIGNLLGAQWAYVELGWGGYWAWDPVENASLLPWLTGTAFVHSLMVQKTRDMMRGWNVTLIITTFLLTILGTFITRSGIISSVHAFGRSNIGTLFLVFMGVILTVFLILIFWRWQKLQSKTKVESFLSREFSFLLNNFIFIVLMVAILWGTMYPAFTEIFIGKQIALGEIYFNKISVPIGIFLIFLLSVCPLFSWKQTKNNKLIKKAIIPVIGTTVFIIILLISGIRHFNSLLVLGFSFLTVSVIFAEIIQGAISRKNSHQEKILQSLRQVLKSNVRRYSGYLVHLGMVMIYVAIVGTTVYKQEKEITLPKGAQTTIGDYRIVYSKMGERHDANKDVLTAELVIYKGDKKLGVLIPERHLYKSGMGERQQTSEVALRSNLKEDLYVIFASYQDDESATFKILLNPMMIWMWIGGFVITVGVIIILVHSIRDKKTRSM